MKVNCGVLIKYISDQLPVILCTSISKIASQHAQQCCYFIDQKVRLYFKALSESDITPILSDTDPHFSFQKLQKLYTIDFEKFFFY